MAIDFHAGSNQYSYARRVAHAGWGDFIQQRVDPAGKAIADIGGGGGIYSAAWAGLGARQVTGVDFSAQMLQDAQETVQGLTNVAFLQGDATATGLADASQDIVFARALIHHFDSPQPFLHGAWRILAPGGTSADSGSDAGRCLLAGIARAYARLVFRSVSVVGRH